MTRPQTKRKSIRSLILLLIICFILGGSYDLKAESDMVYPRRILKVGISELKGISETDAYGHHSGLFIDYLNEIAKYTGWEYEYIQVDNDEIINQFLEGRFDLMGGTFYSPNFEKYFGYPELSAGCSRAVLLALKDNDALQSYNLNSIQGKTIGVYDRAVEKIKYLEEFLAKNNLDCELRYYAYEDRDDTGNLYSRLINQEVDMLLGNDMEIGGDFRMIASFEAQPYYIVTQPQNTEILQELNQALQYILESTPNFEEERYAANFPDMRKNDIQLNDKEIQYVADNPVITVAVPKIWHPFYCLENAYDNHDGVLPELFQEIGEFTGLRFEYVYAETYLESVELVKQGKADILGTTLSTEEQAAASGLALSRPYLTLNNIIIKHKSVNYPDSNLTCGILKGRVLPDSIQAKSVKEYDTPAELVSAVNRHEIDFLYGISSILEQEMQIHRYTNVVPVTQAIADTEVAFAIAQPIKPELLTILNKAIGNLSSEEKDVILNRNMVSMGYGHLTLQDLIYANPVGFILIISGVLFVIMAGCVLIIKSRMKNAVMKSQLEAAEAKSSAKSDFLSQMSHEIRTPMNAIVGLADLTCMEKNVPPDVEVKLKKIRSSSQYLLSLINDILDMSRIENGKMNLEAENFSLTLMLEELEMMMRPQAMQKELRFQTNFQIEHAWLIGDILRLRQVLTNLLSNAFKFTSNGGTVTLCVKEVTADSQTASFLFSVQDTGIGISPQDQQRIFISFEQISNSVSRSVGTGLGLPISQNIVGLMGGKLEVESEVGVGSRFFMTLKFHLGTPKEDKQTAPAISAEGLWNGMRVLLAEDNDLNAEIAEELLTMQGIDVSRASNGQEAVDLFITSEPGYFQAVLMDVQMPVKNGHEATREIRACLRSDANLPIIAMTANSFKEDQEAAQEAGMDGFVSKPVDFNKLFAVLRALLHKPEKEEEKERGTE